jgi:RNA-binding protein
MQFRVSQILCRRAYAILAVNFLFDRQVSMAKSTLTNTQLKELKAIGHQLNPVVIVGGNGLTDSLIEEVNRALNDHELIKVKIPAGSKEERDAVNQAISEATGSTIVTSIGRMVLLLRRNPEANPKLSNLARFG